MIFIIGHNQILEEEKISGNAIPSLIGVEHFHQHFNCLLIVGKKISRVNPSDSVGKSVGKNIPRLRLRNSVGNLSFKHDCFE